MGGGSRSDLPSQWRSSGGGTGSGPPRHPLGQKQATVPSSSPFQQQSQRSDAQPNWRDPTRDSGNNYQPSQGPPSSRGQDGGGSRRAPNAYVLPAQRTGGEPRHQPNQPAPQPAATQNAGEGASKVRVLYIILKYRFVKCRIFKNTLIEPNQF